MNISIFRKHTRLALALCVVTIATFLAVDTSLATPPLSPRAANLIQAAKPRVQKELDEKGFTLGQAIFVRIFKMPRTLEVWMKKNNRYQLFKEYSICNYSGYPGPKLQEGDWQSPEGFYSVSARQMNPNSSYHLSFNIGYPNAFDQSRERTGSAIMVHGGCSSRGCFAMGNRQIEDIYLLAHSALSQGQDRFDVHVFPFKLTSSNLFKFRSSPWIGFWKKLQPGFDYFERDHQIPEIIVEQGNYIVADKTVRVAMAKNQQKETNQ